MVGPGSRRHPGKIGRMSVQAAARRFHLAQFNIGKMRHPGSAAEMAGYDEALTRVLLVAVAWPGFVWIMDDDIIAMIEGRFSQGFAANLSVWSDIESLQGFMDCPPHAAAMGRRNGSRRWPRRPSCSGGSPPAATRTSPRAVDAWPTCAATARAPRRSPWRSPFRHRVSAPGGDVGFHFSRRSRHADRRLSAIEALAGAGR